MATVNPWKRFIGLLPGGSRTVAKVISQHASSGTSTVQFRNGTQARVKGITVTPGGHAFIIDGRITGPAPELAQYQTEV